MTTQSEKGSKRQIAFLRRLADAKVRLAESIKGLDETTLCDQLVLGDWTIKDILGHIVSWNQEFRANIEMILQGEHPGYDHEISGKENFDDWNHAWIAKKRAFSLHQILLDVESDYHEAVDLINRLKAEDFQKRGVTPWKEAAANKPAELTKADTDTVETLITYHWRHMNQHCHEIEAWRKRR